MGTVTALPGAKAFWGEMAPCDHIVQIYGDDNVFIDSFTKNAAESIVDICRAHSKVAP